MNAEILETIRSKGLLLEKDIFELVGKFENVGRAKEFLEQIERISGQKMITKNLLSRNFEYMKSFMGKLPGEEKLILEKIFVNWGLSLEIQRFSIEPPLAQESLSIHSSADATQLTGMSIRRETEILGVKKEEEGVREKPRNQNYRIFYSETIPDKKIEVKDFVGHFRARFQQIQRILMTRGELQNGLVSINKIANDRASLSIIGIVKEKRVTKNKNMIIRFEDLTGEINGLVKFDNPEIFLKAEELLLDDIVGIKGSGNKDMIFVHDIFYPDAFLHEKTKFNEDVCIAFLSDLHVGSDRHLKKSINNFLEWINSDDPIASKIHYIFFVGDNVDGVGIFPGQEDVLELKTMEEQYKLLDSYLRKIPGRITMFMCPGQHDASRVAEPQPLISKRYAPELYEIENLVLVTNPTLVKLYEGEKEFKVLMYHGASIHGFINEIKELRDLKAHLCPSKAIRHMLKRRHLAPTHSDFVYIPNSEVDPMVIKEVPDVLCTGEVHRLDIENYNGILGITGSCWQAQTDFEEKIGNIPDPAKVPVLNLKTRELRIFDFGVEEEINKEY